MCAHLSAWLAHFHREGTDYPVGKRGELKGGCNLDVAVMKRSGQIALGGKRWAKCTVTKMSAQAVPWTRTIYVEGKGEGKEMVRIEKEGGVCVKGRGR